VKLVIKALTMDLSGKITMLVAILHRPEKGQCSCKQYYLPRTKIEYSCM
jgi:hypothetical protein